MKQNEPSIEIPEKTDTNDNIIDVNIEGIKKQRFRINGRKDAILELDTSDINIISRLQEVYPKLNKLALEATRDIEINSDKTVEEQLDEMAVALKEIDIKMREYVDYIFDSNVSEICAPSGSMYSPHGGKFTFEHITETIGALYANRIDSEAQQLSKRLKAHTEKYTSRKRK